MSVRSSAMLMYGIPLTKGDYKIIDDLATDDEIPETVCKRKGVDLTVYGYQMDEKVGVYFEDDEDDDEDDDKGQSGWFLVPRDHKIHEVGYSGDIKPLGNQIIAEPEWRDILEKACQELGIKFCEPQWYLARYIG